MKTPLLLVEKVEFIHTKVETNPDYKGDFSDEFHQIDFSFNGVTFKRKMTLQYDEASSEDPRHFVFGLNLILENGEPNETVLPYNIDVRAVVYFKYRSDTHVGMERFRAVRATGYSILYGAIREMVSNLTARSSHGMWSLPAADFNSASQEEAERDEARRQKYLSKKAKDVTPRRKAASKLAESKQQEKSSVPKRRSKKLEEDSGSA